MRCLSQKTFSAIKVRVDQQQEMALCDLGGWVKTPRQGTSSLQPPSCWWPVHKSIAMVSFSPPHSLLVATTAAERDACTLLLVLPSLVAHAAARSNGPHMLLSGCIQFDRWAKSYIFRGVWDAQPKLPLWMCCSRRLPAAVNKFFAHSTKLLGTNPACFFSLQLVLDG
jgi:hypothetical protein